MRPFRRSRKIGRESENLTIPNQIYSKTFRLSKLYTFKNSKLGELEVTMKTNQPNSIWQRSSFWAIAVGIAIVGASFAAFHGSKAYADRTSGGSIAPETAREFLHALDSSMADLAKRVEPAVVHIEVGSTRANSPMGQIKAEGSGVIYSSDGWIITNDHVVNGMDSVKVTLTDGRTFDGKVTRSDDAGDIALVKIDAKDLPTIPFEDSDRVMPGNTAMAIGSPFGLDNTVTIGHISALDRGQLIGDSRFPGGARYYADLIQTDAAINSGNSGGALVDVDGKLIGINTAIASSTGGSNGIGFAVPSNQVKLIADLLIKDGKVERAFLGVEPAALKDVQKQQLGTEVGAFVKRVEPKSPADLAGIKAEDVITQVEDTKINTFMDLRNAMYKYKSGNSIKITVLRNKKSLTMEAKLTTPPRDVARTTPRGGSMPSPFGDSPLQDPFGNDTPFRGNPFRGLPSPRRSGAAHFGAMVSPVTGDIRAQYHIPSDKSGAVVVSTEPGSVAEKLGLQPGDLITSFNGKTVASADDLVTKLHDVKWGDSASVSFSRFGDGGSVSIKTQTFTFE